jgi:hypothetical protein
VGCCSSIVSNAKLRCQSVNGLRQLCDPLRALRERNRSRKKDTLAQSSQRTAKLAKKFIGPIAFRVVSKEEARIGIYWKKDLRLSREMTTLDLNFGASGGKLASRLLILNLSVVRLP